MRDHKVSESHEGISSIAAASGVFRSMQSNVPRRQDQAALAGFIGKRLREAREIACLGQLEASKRLGYSNSSKLSKIEGGKSSEIPIWMLKRAARIYDVSLDYLFGNTETMERDDVAHAALREMSVFMVSDWDRLRARDLIAIARQRERVTEIETLLYLALEQAEEAEQVRLRIEQCSEWQDVRGGTKWSAASSRIASTLRTAKKRLSRYHAEARMAGGASLQPSLVLE